ncbi:FAD-dependent monooxygenase [Actinomycetospora cinnamomea]|uniref:FAD-dependent monooxygenase n=1 Tax=Actinomycetospora cinnamomea TaxID=663609 RepID=UPI001A9CA179|nr:FAD-dependent monooxygenase [Actinomycetospora cinnamomea]
MAVVVCGAGIAGLALARELGRAGIPVKVLERASGPRSAGYMMDFFGPGQLAAEETGLLPLLAQVAYSVTAVTYVDRRGHPTAEIDYAAATRAVGGRLLSLLRGDLERVLRHDLGPLVDLRFGVTVTEVVPRGDGVTVASADGTRLDALAVVGADGVHSAVRAAVHGPEQTFLRPLGLHTAAWTFRDAALRARLGDRFVMTDTVGHGAGLYGLAGDEVAAAVFHPAPRDDPLTLPDDAAGTVRAVHRDLGWVVPDALAHCPDGADLYYDVVAQVELPRWSRGRVTLLGDAAGAVSLLAGQGASLAVAGAHVLAGELAPALAGSGDVEEALRRYEHRMRPVTTACQEAGRRSADWFLPPTRTRLLARRLALRALRLPGFDRLAARRLVGTAGALP